MVDPWEGAGVVAVHHSVPGVAPPVFRRALVARG